MLNSTEHEISNARKDDNVRELRFFLALKLSDVEFTLLINVKIEHSEFHSRHRGVARGILMLKPVKY